MLNSEEKPEKLQEKFAKQSEKSELTINYEATECILTKKRRSPKQTDIEL